MSTINIAKMVSYKHLLDAHEQGKTIQMFSVQKGDWINVVSINPAYPPDVYRVKPTEEYIPWDALTAPLAGVSFMRKGDTIGKFLCLSVTEDGYLHSNGTGLYTFQEMLDKYLHAKVGQPGWWPCGLKI